MNELVQDTYCECIHFFCLVSSGLLNFCAVALTLCDLGYKPLGVRLDSGDLCKQSSEIRRVFRRCSEQWVRCSAPCVEAACVTADLDNCLNVVWLCLCSFSVPDFDSLTIVGSNSISEDNMLEFNQVALFFIFVVAVATYFCALVTKSSIFVSGEWNQHSWYWNTSGHMHKTTHTWLCL